MQIRIMAAILAAGLTTGGAFANTRADYPALSQAASQPSMAQSESTGVKIAQADCTKNGARKCCYDGAGKRVCK
jgi:hypothetical protein